MGESPTASFDDQDAAGRPYAGGVVAAGAHIGRYRLLKPLGEGGMGQVWLAEQTEPLVRTVAVKLIRSGYDSGRIVSRFESERQALALMDHPGIAKVFDAGATAEGLPFFVMEYVEGVPVTDYCDRQALDISARLDLFVQVCDAVQHAHRKAILHRDLKPSNVLVATVDGRPQIKVIDFGLAKALERPQHDRAAFTELGILIGTPEYMSPEQADLANEDIDTRADVYSLGVMLYELLVGALPIDSAQLRRAGYLEIMRVIREVEPPTPSTKVMTVEPAAMRRSTRLDALRGRLSGDLDWITMKALAKARSERYGSASDFAEDIRRHRLGLPVNAVPPTARYRTGKFVRRHKAPVIVAATFVLLLGGFSATLAIQARRLAVERDRATLEAHTSQRVVEFLTSLFQSPDPARARGRVVTAREVLDGGRARLAALDGEPRVQAELMHTMARVYSALGDAEASLGLFTVAYARRAALLGPDDPATLESRANIPIQLAALGRLREAETAYRQVLEARRRVLGPDAERTVNTLSNLGTLYVQQNRAKEALPIFEEVLAARQRRGEGPLLWTAQSNLAAVLGTVGRVTDALALARGALASERKALGSDHPSTLATLEGVNGLEWQAHQREAAISGAQEALEIRRRVLGREHRDTFVSESKLAVELAQVGRRAEAEPLYRHAVEGQRRVLGPNNPNTLDTMNNLAVLLIDMARYPEAERLLTDVLEGYRTTYGPRDQRTTVAMYNLAALSAAKGDMDTAFHRLDGAIAMGFSSADAMAADSALARLRTDRRYPGYLARVRANQ